MKFLTMKEESDFTGQEGYVSDCMKTHDPKWFPVGRALVKDFSLGNVVTTNTGAAAATTTSSSPDEKDDQQQQKNNLDASPITVTPTTSLTQLQQQQRIQKMQQHQINLEKKAASRQNVRQVSAAPNLASAIFDQEFSNNNFPQHLSGDFAGGVTTATVGVAVSGEDRLLRIENHLARLESLLLAQLGVGVAPYSPPASIQHRNNNNNNLQSNLAHGLPPF